MNLPDNLSGFIRSYIETALWSSTDDDGLPLDDDKYAETEFAHETLRKIISDCTLFEVQSEPIFASHNHVERSERIAHDFWLTRNRHGAGFWDGDYPEQLGKELTELSHRHGEVNLYIGDDGQFYLY